MLIEGVAASWLDIGATGLVVLIVLLILADKLWTERRAKAVIALVEENARRAVAVAEKQRDDVLVALRESHEVGRINAESIRDITGSVEQLADGQEVAVNLIRSALPSPVRRDA